MQCLETRFCVLECFEVVHRLFGELETLEEC